MNDTLALHVKAAILHMRATRATQLWYIENINYILEVPTTVKYIEVVLHNCEIY